MQQEKWIHHQYVYQGRIVSVKTGDVELEDGTVAFREIIEHPGGVGIVPVIGDDVILVKQYRLAIGQEILEIPAGKREGNDEALELRAQAELEEETGYHAGRLVKVGSAFASVGYTSELIHLFLAFDLQEVGQRLEFDERINVVRIPIARIKSMLANGEIQDSKTVVALFYLFQALDKKD